MTARPVTPAALLVVVDVDHVLHGVDIATRNQIADVLSGDNAVHVVRRGYDAYVRPDMAVRAECLTCGWLSGWHDYTETGRRELLHDVNGHRAAVTDPYPLTGSR